MSNQTISEAARKAAKAFWNDRVRWNYELAKLLKFEDLLTACQSAIDAAARVEPTDKDTERLEWVMQHPSAFQKIFNDNCGGHDWEENERMRKAIDASLPATPTPQGQTSEQTGIPDKRIEQIAKVWAEDDGLWTTQGTVETNLCRFASVLLDVDEQWRALGSEVHAEKRQTVANFLISLLDFVCGRDPNEPPPCLWRVEEKIRSYLLTEHGLSSSPVLTPAAPSRKPESGGASLGAATDKEGRFS